MSLETLINARPGGTKALFCLEINPPRGTDLSTTYQRLDGKLAGLDFLNVTDSALARMKFAALPFGSLLKARYGIEPLVNLSCRDRNMIAMQGDLLAAWATGVRSVVALTGDAVSIGDLPQAKGVFEVNSIGLLKVLETLNSGVDLSGTKLKGSPGFCPGVVVNPNAKNPLAEIKRLTRKAEAGARYALSQPVFDPEGSRSFFLGAKGIGMPILMGLLPLKSRRGVEGVLKVPGIRMPDSFIAAVKASATDDISRFSMDHCIALARSNKEAVCGFHVVSGATPALALELVQELMRLFKEG